MPRQGVVSEGRVRSAGEEEEGRERAGGPRAPEKARDEADGEGCAGIGAISTADTIVAVDEELERGELMETESTGDP